jgi:methionyl-tRNA formyltransferase
MVKVMLVGNVEPQTSAVRDVLTRSGHMTLHCWTPDAVRDFVDDYDPALIVVAGYRRLLPADIVERFPTVGFHSAKLPEYPGRAPVYWTLLRGDRWTANTLLYLDAGVDSGDIIDSRPIPVLPTDTPESLYRQMARTAADMLALHLPALLDGTAPRRPQDPALRGPLTTKAGYRLYRDRYPVMP